MQIIIDRFEGEFAVCALPDGSFENVPKTLFPGAREGEIFDIVRNTGEENKMLEKQKKLINKLFRD